MKFWWGWVVSVVAAATFNVYAWLSSRKERNEQRRMLLEVHNMLVYLTKGRAR